MRRVIAAVGAVAALQAGFAAAAPVPGAALGCVATHTFTCGPDGCAREAEVSNGSVRLYLDLASGIGELCEYTQCRGIAAARFGEGPGWTGHVALGPSSSVVIRSANGEDIEGAALLPTLGALLGIDPSAGTFLFSQQSGTTVSGYSGTCEDAAGG